MILRGLGRVGGIENADLVDRSPRRLLRSRIPDAASDQFERDALCAVDREDVVGIVGRLERIADGEIVIERAEVVAIGRLHSDGDRRAQLAKMKSLAAKLAAATPCTTIPLAEVEPK